MLDGRQITKTTARILIAMTFIGYICGLGVVLYTVVLMEQINSTVREAVVAMNDPGRLSNFEQQLQAVRLITGLFLLGLVTVTAIPGALVVRMSMAALRKD